MDEAVLTIAIRTAGWMTPAEGLGLFAFARLAALLGGPMVEIGAYCGRSTVFLGSGAKAHGGIVFSVDHHRGSPEHQVGAEDHDPMMVDPLTGRFDTLPYWRRTIAAAGLESTVIGIVSDSATFAAHWNTPLSLVFIDGGHDAEAAWSDYRSWTPHIKEGGFLLLHDVYPPEAGGGFGYPWDIYRHAVESGAFVEVADMESLRALRRVPGGESG